MKPNVKRYVISVGVGLALAFVVMLLRDIFSQTDSREILVILNDAFFISGMCLVCVGGLVFVSNNGMFYMLSYGVSLIFSVRKWSKGKKYKDYYEYKTAKEKKQHGFAYLLVVGLAFIAVASALLIWI